jgi:hypothetical protein
LSGQTKLNPLNLLAFQYRLNRVRGAAYLWTFRHGRITLAGGFSERSKSPALLLLSNRAHSGIRDASVSVTNVACIEGYTAHTPRTRFSDVEAASLHRDYRAVFTT